MERITPREYVLIYDQGGEGAKHSWWGNPANGRRSAVPRHVDISDGLARKIYRDLGVPEP